MKLRIWLVASLTLATYGCSTPPRIEPLKIDPPPLVLTTPCPLPGDLIDLATARELASWAIEWINVAACEALKRQALLSAWPR